MNTSNLIIGYGQLGKALKEVFSDCQTIDKGRRIDLKNPSFIHIAFPYSAEFGFEIKKYIQIYKPKIVIIHSTLKLGTIRKISEKIKKEVVHSPVLGQHNQLSESLLVFEKWIGGIDKKTNLKVFQYFKKFGLMPKIKSSPEITEMAKLFQTTRYALNIAFAQEQYRFLKNQSLDYTETVLDFERMFNLGSKKLNQEHLNRPLLIPGEIGGHCLLPNLQILKSLFSSKFLDLIEESNEQFKKSH